MTARGETERPDDIATERDILHLYRLLLRRDPESSYSEGEGTDLRLMDLLTEVLHSDEFRNPNLGPLRTGHLPSTSLDAPPQETLEWALERLGLSDDVKEQLRSAVSYLQAYCAILSEENIRGALATEADFYSPAACQALQRAARLQALADIPQGHALTGWARSTDLPAAPHHVEIWANGRYLGTATTGLYRYDAAARLNSEGYEGFQFELPHHLFGRTRILVRDAESRVILADFVADISAAQPDALASLRREVEALKEAVGHLEERLPQASQSASYPLDRYGEYYDACIRTAVLAVPTTRDPSVVVLLDAIGCAQSDIEDAIWSLAEQRHDRFSVVVGASQEDSSFLQDVIARVRWRRDITIACVIVGDGTSAWRHTISLSTDVEVVQLMKASGVAHPDALRCMTVPFLSSPQPAAVYCDEDAFLHGDLQSWRDQAHTAPKLKPAFDYDLLLQTPYVGSFVAFDRTHWSALEQEAEREFAAEQMALLLAQAGGDVVHVSEVLYTSSSSKPSDGSSWARLVGACLSDHAEVERHRDVLGSTLEEACRVRWRRSSNASALIIVPTRDRIDLLEPCVDSVLASLSSNVTGARIRIIDHESSDPAALAYLSKIGSHAVVDVDRFTGPFNWALMNNLAAHKSEEDVLIFLNNDTRVINPDWVDELVSLAMRQDVGVVGCRLIYEDGAIQHAGFLALNERRRFLIHDGLGDPGSYPGYLGRNALVHRTVAVTGACLAVRREVFRRLGGFDAARLQVEANDVDLCFKAADLGLKVLYSPYATLHHLESRTRTTESADDVRTSREAAERIWSRWGKSVCHDPWYNPRFDRRSPHFSRLVPGRFT